MTIHEHSRDLKMIPRRRKLLLNLRSIPHCCLQLGHMNHWMNVTIRRQLQTISNGTNLGNDLKGTIIAESQFMVGSTSNRRLHIRLELQIHPVTVVELSKGYVLICIHLHLLLSPVKMLLNQLMHYLPVFQPIR